MSARLDLVVFGATGFTGRLVCQYLRRHAPPGLRWALAGRDAANLERVATALESLPDLAAGAGAVPCEVINGCSGDGSAAARICGDLKPRVVLSTAGPFVHHSDALVAACARAGVSYVDINGEIPWVARVIERDDGPARESKALIVPNCGFDSVPSDLGAMRATSLLAAKTQSPCVHIQTVRRAHWCHSGTSSVTLPSLTLTVAFTFF
jgi:saccharopine dehydrogenase (NAD+, L-glutamate forming)